MAQSIEHKIKTHTCTHNTLHNNTNKGLQFR